MKIFLDVGAYKGDTAQSVLSSKHKFDKIICFEPQINFGNKIRSLKNPKIEVVDHGLWNKTCTAPIYLNAAKKTGRISDGASVYADKFAEEKIIKNVNMIKASDWFRDNLSKDNFNVLKMNCEGAECDILDDLLDSGQFNKVNALMVDFDVRKIPSQTHRESEIMKRLASFKIPIHIVDRYDQWTLRGQNSTHYWMDKIL